MPAAVPRRPLGAEASLLSLFSLAEELAGRSPEQARRIYWLLRFPFAASVMDDPRRRLLVDVARLADWPALCRDALAQLEPHVPWQQPLLEQRLDCYLRHGDPRAELAEEELRSFLAQQISVIAPADLPPAEPAEIGAATGETARPADPPGQGGLLDIPLPSASPPPLPAGGPAADPPLPE